MKQLLPGVLLGLALAGCTTTGWSEAPRDDGYYVSGAPVGWWGRDVVSVDLFYGPLASYGTWGLHPRYGRVFMPRVDRGWQPYARGYWREDPRYGRSWASSEPWGWATYHYGRWGRDDRLGWFWVPDTRFGPGWVDWRAGNGYASWAPLPPYGWSAGGWGSWSNDWWLHAPSSWLYRPGLYDHVRRGRHDWDRDRDRDRPGWSDDRDGRPRSPVRIPDSAVPGPADPPPAGWVGGERQPDGTGYRRGERQRNGEGWRGGERPGLARQPGTRPDGVNPRSAPPGRQVAAAPPRAEVAPVQAAPSQAAPSQAARPESPRAEPRRPDSPVRVREAPRGRDVPPNVADD